MSEKKFNIIQDAEFDFPIDSEAENELYWKVFDTDPFTAGKERCGCLKVHYLEGVMEVIDFWGDELVEVVIAKNYCRADPTPYLNGESLRITWHTHPEDFPVPSERDFTYFLANKLNFELILGRKAYLVIMREGEQFKTKYVEWQTP